MLIAASGVAERAGTAVAGDATARKPRRRRPSAPPIAPRCSRRRSKAHAAPEGATTGQRAEPLSDKLARSDGVLCPPAGIDPEIRAPTPETGNTPVIPPPGSPGGDPTVRPK